MSRITKPWQDAEVTQLRKLYIEQGESLTSTAKVLGRTRGSVISKVHRTGLFEERSCSTARINHSISTRRKRPRSFWAKVSLILLHNKHGLSASELHEKVKASGYRTSYNTPSLMNTALNLFERKGLVRRFGSNPIRWKHNFFN